MFKVILMIACSQVLVHGNEFVNDKKLTGQEQVSQPSETLSQPPTPKSSANTTLIKDSGKADSRRTGGTKSDGASFGYVWNIGNGMSYLKMHVGHGSREGLEEAEQQIKNSLSGHGKGWHPPRIEPEITLFEDAAGNKSDSGRSSEMGKIQYPDVNQESSDVNVSGVKTTDDIGSLFTPNDAEKASGSMQPKVPTSVTEDLHETSGFGGESAQRLNTDVMPTIENKRDNIFDEGSSSWYINVKPTFGNIEYGNEGKTSTNINGHHGAVYQTVSTGSDLTSAIGAFVSMGYDNAKINGTENNPKFSSKQNHHSQQVMNKGTSQIEDPKFSSLVTSTHMPMSHSLELVNDQTKSGNDVFNHFPNIAQEIPQGHINVHNHNPSNYYEISMVQSAIAPYGNVRNNPIDGQLSSLPYHLQPPMKIGNLIGMSNGWHTFVPFYYSSWKSNSGFGTPVIPEQAENMHNQKYSEGIIAGNQPTSETRIPSHMNNYVQNYVQHGSRSSPIPFIGSSQDLSGFKGIPIMINFDESFYIHKGDQNRFQQEEVGEKKLLIGGDRQGHTHEHNPDTKINHKIGNMNVGFGVFTENYNDPLKGENNGKKFSSDMPEGKTHWSEKNISGSKIAEGNSIVRVMNGIKVMDSKEGPWRDGQIKEQKKREDRKGRMASAIGDHTGVQHLLAGSQIVQHGYGRFHDHRFSHGYEQEDKHEITRAVPVEQVLKIPVMRPVRQPILVPYPVGVVEPYPFSVPVPVPVERTVQVPVEKVVPYPVVKHVPVKVYKEVPVPVLKPYPVKVPVYKVKYVHHSKKDHS